MFIPLASATAKDSKKPLNCLANSFSRFFLTLVGPNGEEEEAAETSHQQENDDISVHGGLRCPSCGIQKLIAVKHQTHRTADEQRYSKRPEASP